MHAVHADLRAWMEQAGMRVQVDAAGNLRGCYDGATADVPTLIVGSHLDTVPHAGAFDGILGVVMGVALVKALAGRRLGFGIEVVGFSEEEGVRFGLPFIGSRALVGRLDDTLLAKRDAAGVSVADAIRAFGLNPAAIGEARLTGTAARLPGVSHRTGAGAGEFEPSTRCRYRDCRAEPARSEVRRQG